jgi:hypothetical protein
MKTKSKQLVSREHVYIPCVDINFFCVAIVIDCNGAPLLLN